jgi:hypothetical protein
MITDAQLRKLHSLRRALGIEDGDYRLALAERFNVTSAKDLSQRQAAVLIGGWEDQAVAAGVWVAQPKRDIPRRPPQFATEAQLRMVRKLFDKVARCPVAEREGALDKLVKRIVKKERLRFLAKRDVAPMVAALEAMDEARRVA